MDDQARSLRAVFAEATRKQSQLTGDTNSTAFQENLSSAITTFEECLQIASRVSLFSPNETLDDVSSGDLQYMLIHFHLAELVLKITGGDRNSNLARARAHYEQFLKLLDSYDVLPKPDGKMYEQYKEDPQSFSTASKTDAAARRQTKIARFREEKELKRKLEVCSMQCLLAK